MRYRRPALFCGLLGLVAGIALCGCKSSDTAEDITAAKVHSINNLKQIAIALHNHHDANGTLPSAGPPPGAKRADSFGSPFGWRVEILSYMENVNLYHQIDRKSGVLPDSVLNAEIPAFQHPFPSKRKGSETHYRVFVGKGAAFETDRGVNFGEFRDGLPNTILAVEAAEPIAWHGTDDFHYDPNQPLPKLGIFPGGFHALMGDGTVCWFPVNTDEQTIRALITRSGGEKVAPPQPVGSRE